MCYPPFLFSIWLHLFKAFVVERIMISAGEITSPALRSFPDRRIGLNILSYDCSHSQALSRELNSHLAPLLFLKMLLLSLFFPPQQTKYAATFLTIPGDSPRNKARAGLKHSSLDSPLHPPQLRLIQLTKARKIAKVEGRPLCMATPLSVGEEKIWSRGKMRLLTVVVRRPACHARRPSSKPFLVRGQILGTTVQIHTYTYI